MRRHRAIVIGSIAALLVAGSIAAAMTAFGGTAAANACSRNQLNVRDNGSEGGAGTIRGAWVFTNRSDTTCSLNGYPDLQLFRNGGRPLSTTTKKNLAPAPTRVVLHPDRSATFLSSYSDVPSGSEKCGTSRVLEITAPGATAGLFIPAKLGPCGGVIRVSAVEAGVHGP
ncbi:MAG: DUF4232 domain-containing protein [Actinomycetota bacterium]